MWRRRDNRITKDYTASVPIYRPPAMRTGTRALRHTFQRRKVSNQPWYRTQHSHALLTTFPHLFPSRPRQQESQSHTRVNASSLSLPHAKNDDNLDNLQVDEVQTFAGDSQLTTGQDAEHRQSVQQGCVVVTTPCYDYLPTPRLVSAAAAVCTKHYPRQARPKEVREG